MHTNQTFNTEIPQGRIASLDLIRGVAVLGILLMNIQSFSMIDQAYLNPMAYGDMTGLNKWMWIISHLLADQKFLSIFSMLFGASMYMIAQKAEEKSGSSWQLHFRRNGWLLIFGLIHGSLLWYGDILAPYAACSFVIYFFRKWPVKRLLIFGLCVFAVASVVHVVKGLELLQLPEAVISQMQNGWQPDERIVKYMVSGYQGSYTDQLTQRLRMLEIMYTQLFPSFYVWRISGLMLIGMALFKSGFLQGRFDKAVYRKVLHFGLGLGFPLVIGGMVFNFSYGWDMQYSMYFGAEFNYWGSLFMSMAYISALILWVKSGWGLRLMTWLSSAGRMALTNYLMQTLICTMLFYGFGWFGEVSRMGQAEIVLMVWLVQLTLSHYWMRSFRFGPFEWLWRSLTQMKVQTMRKNKLPPHKV